MKVTYARDLHKTVAHHPKDLDLEVQDIVQQSIEENEDDLMRDMHPESYRLAVDADKHMNEEGAGYTYAQYAESGGDLGPEFFSEEDDDYDEQGMTEVGLEDASDNEEGPNGEDKGDSGLSRAELWRKGIRVDAKNPSKPTASNNIAQAKSKAKHPIDPNGRFVGRHLVNWHREYPFTQH